MNSMLLTDGYKLDHRRQYPKGTSLVYSTWIPRNMEYMSDKLGTEINQCVAFGFQYFIKKVLIEGFYKNFFRRDKNKVVAEYQKFIDDFMPNNTIGTKHIEELHDLGYLPIEIKCLEEGSLCPKGVPMLTIVNTHPDFFWITNYLETVMSAGLWLATNSATIAYQFKKNLYQHLKNTIGLEGTELYRDFLVHDFSMRGMGGVDAAINSGLGHIALFSGSETLPAIQVAKEYYSAEPNVCATVPATEHSVMCAGSKENEFETYKRLLTEVYPEGFVSIVSDTWDYWNVIQNYIPRLKDVIMNRNGRFVVRPDSGNPVYIICGYNYLQADNTDEKSLSEFVQEWFAKYQNGDTTDNVDVLQIDNQTKQFFVRDNDNNFYRVTIGNNAFLIDNVDEYIVRGTYETLWSYFGGTQINGYKVLDTHIGVIYGDSITVPVQHEIYKRLEGKGFAATNLVLGVGSYTYQNNTRDQLGFAMKATYVMIDGVGHEIFKKPKTDNGLKKSLKGICCVYENENGLYVKDQQPQESYNHGLLKTVFVNGMIVKEFTMSQVREKINQSLLKEIS